jgi:hypothetical protein
MRWRNRGRRRRQRIKLRSRFDRACDAFELELGEVLARIRAEVAA